MTAMDVVALLVLVLFIARLLARSVASRYRTERFGDSVEFVRTEDGWKIALHRYRPTQRKYEEPILLCHGLGANRYNFDLEDDTSLARCLAEAGFDVWSLELRGAGLSVSRNEGAARFEDTCFDTYLERDVAAAAARVAGESRQGRYFWIGHSMGGMLGLAWAGTGRQPQPAGIVAIGSPVDFTMAGKVRGMRFAMRVMSFFGRAPLRYLASTATALVVRPSVAARILCQGEQVGAATQRLALVNLVEDVPGKLLGQFLSWHSRVGFFSLDGRVDYLESLATVEIPCLIIGADSDRLAPPESVEPAYEKLAAQDKQIRILGSERGDDGDYGHGDLLLGRMAPQEVFPMLVEWLERRATPFSENQSGDEA